MAPTPGEKPSGPAQSFHGVGDGLGVHIPESSEGLSLGWDLVTVGNSSDPETRWECH